MQSHMVTLTEQTVVKYPTADATIIVKCGFC